jgi:uncharacterized protein
MTAQEGKKLEEFKKILKHMGSLLVAYSGGVDSTFLLAVAKEVLANRVLAVTARSATYPEREIVSAGETAQQLGVRYRLIDSEELSLPEFRNNPLDRCFYCKRELFSRLRNIAQEEGIPWIADGSNVDDDRDFRPGSRAVQEMGIRSPLKEAGLTKEDIRKLSSDMGLPTWDKPSIACLASRFPYGEEITTEKLTMVGRAEEYLLNMGFRQVRVRHHQNIARIEVGEEEVKRFFDCSVRKQVVEKLKEIGYTYITLDLEGYRLGSMNEVLREIKKSQHLKNQHLKNS